MTARRDELPPVPPTMVCEACQVRAVEGVTIGGRGFFVCKPCFEGLGGQMMSSSPEAWDPEASGHWFELFKAILRHGGALDSPHQAARRAARLADTALEEFYMRFPVEQPRARTPDPARVEEAPKSTKKGPSERV